MYYGKCANAFGNKTHMTKVLKGLKHPSCKCPRVATTSEKRTSLCFPCNAYVTVGVLMLDESWYIFVGEKC